MQCVQTAPSAMTTRTIALARLAENVGPDGALALAALYGGRRLYVPHAPRAGHVLADLLGVLVFARLCYAFRGTTIYVPRLPVAPALARRARDLRGGGASVAAIAVAIGRSERQVLRYLRAA